jgi:hypothetical protein
MKPALNAKSRCLIVGMARAEFFAVPLAACDASLMNPPNLIGSISTARTRSCNSVA